MNETPRRVLTLNGGSSSLKFAAFEPGLPPRRAFGGGVPTADPPSALRTLVGEWERDGVLKTVRAVGHRIVHGGPERFDPQSVSPELLADLERARPLDPHHLPAALALIGAVAKLLPGVPQFACFDTAFHRDLPAAARTLPIPRRYAAEGVRKYGFHGLSYTYLLEELERQAGPAAARGKAVLAHLGSGASMAAVRDGRCLDTTMGLTPAGGLAMGARSGDLDPGVLIHLARRHGLSADDLDDLANNRSGLLGVSETSADMRELLARQHSDPRAAEAVELFCYGARKHVGALAAALGGLETLVFAGGIGQNSPEVRARICAGLEHLGVRLDPPANDAGAAVVSAPGAAVAVRVFRTDEESVIARAVFALLASAPPQAAGTGR